MGRAISCHYFTAVVPTCHVDEIISRWRWKYCEDIYGLPFDNTLAYYQSAALCATLGLTAFWFSSDQRWKSEKMLHDIYEISSQLKCRVLAIYEAGPESTFELILPDAKEITCETYYGLIDEEEQDEEPVGNLHDVLVALFSAPADKLKPLLDTLSRHEWYGAIYFRDIFTKESRLM